MVIIQEPWILGNRVSGLRTQVYKLSVADEHMHMEQDQPDPLQHTTLRAFIADCKTRDIVLLVGCDANAHHCQWESSDINERATRMYPGRLKDSRPASPRYQLS